MVVSQSVRSELISGLVWVGPVLLLLLLLLDIADHNC
jgi:hypothetical protein